jgi:hypothetical protein
MNVQNLRTNELKEMWDRNVDLSKCLYMFTAPLAACLLITGTMAVCTGQQEATEERLI